MSHSGREKREKQSFTTVASLVSALLTDLERSYVTKETREDKKMRKRINKSIELINNYQELSNLIIKGNPFSKGHEARRRIPSDDPEANSTSGQQATPQSSSDLSSSDS